MLGEESYSFSVDMYSVGVILYQLMTLTLPFASVLKIATGQYAPIGTERGYSALLVELARHLMSMNPDERPSAAAVLAQPFVLCALARAECAQKTGRVEAWLREKLEEEAQKTRAMETRMAAAEEKAERMTARMVVAEEKMKAMEAKVVAVEEKMRMMEGKEGKTHEMEQRLARVERVLQERATETVLQTRFVNSIAQEVERVGSNRLVWKVILHVRLC